MKIKLLFLLSFFTLNLFAQSGNLDLSFGNNGKVITNVNGTDDVARGVVIQDDGKIVVAGYSFSDISGYDFLCIRYNEDGSLDNSFGTNGIATFDLQLGSDDRAYSLDLQIDGKIVLGGFSDDGSNRNAAIIRLNTDGSLDTAFGTSGIAVVNVNDEDILRVVKVHQLTGNIVGAGASYSDTEEANAIFLRLTPNGQLDTTFSDDGIITNLPQPVNSSIGFELVIEDIAIKSNGRITAVGWVDIPGNGSALFRADHYACRINADGTLDETFDNNGYDVNVITTGNDRSYSMVLFPDDSFISSGFTDWTSSDYRTYINYMTSSGGSSSGAEAWIQYSTSTQDAGFGMELDNSGNIIVGGVSNNTSTGIASFLVTSLMSDDYSVDTNFGTSGFTTTDFGTFSIAYDLKVQADDKIVLVGFSDTEVALARYIGNTLSLDETNWIQDFSVFPNPTNDHLNFEINDTSFVNSKFEVYDIIGKNVLQGTITNGLNTIDVSPLLDGFYILRIGENTVKFVKSN